MHTAVQRAGVQKLSAVVGENEELVRRIAWRLHRRLPASVQIDDLIQAGMVGLLEAYERYQPEQDASFATFAGIRVRGAMLDEIRRGDWTPRSLHRAARSMRQASLTIERQTGRAASGAAVATAMGLSSDEYQHLCADLDRVHMASLDGLLEANPAADIGSAGAELPEEAVADCDLWAYVTRVMSDLPERDQQLLVLYYERGENLRQIAERMGVSESRVCQLHARALTRMRGMLAAAA
ncbi:MAG: RNA polymerase sigma factor FliA [Salinisphaera sp.]|jgi:RNA polymerase sigma factor for flagellar operon FliA|nr:RNA polymerase sigma factor FliA [Salinisphaera sp.]